MVDRSKITAAKDVLAYIAQKLPDKTLLDQMQILVNVRADAIPLSQKTTILADVVVLGLLGIH
jgi:hypothetical protein